MSSETALLAYVFLGNALNAVLKGVAIDFEEDLGVPRSSCEALCLAVEPLTPRDVLTVIAGLNDDQRVLLVRVGPVVPESPGHRLRTADGSEPGGG